MTPLRIIKHGGRFRLVQQDGRYFVQYFAGSAAWLRCRFAPAITVQTDEAAVEQFTTWLYLDVKRVRQSEPAPNPEPLIPEAEEGFQERIIDLAHLHSWKVAHFRPAQLADGSYRTAVSADGQGFPDLLLVRERIIFREIKTDTGQLSHEQRAWGRWLTAAGQDWDVWRPRHWERITATLKEEPNANQTETRNTEA
jgi:hypothetical protein